MPFTWASGIQSPIYCDNRILLSYPEIRDLVKTELVRISAHFEPFDVVAGVATAGIAHGALVADALHKPFVYVRPKPKEHGRQNLIEGEVLSNASVLVVEDLVSTGGSSLKAVEALQDAGCRITGVIAIFTYGLSEAEESFSNAGVSLETLLNYNVLIREAIDSGYVSQQEQQVLESWQSDPHHWKPA